MAKIGRFTVLQEVGVKHTHRYVRCACECGRVEEVRRTLLMSGRKSQCVSCSQEQSRRSKRSLNNHPLYGTWKRFKAKGLLDPQWADSPLVFIRWCLDHGYIPGRLPVRPDEQALYSPANCEFRPPRVLRRRRRCQVNLNGRSMSVAEAARELGVDRHKLYHQVVTCGRSVRDAVERITTSA